jgi:hypothetical protein
MPIKLNHIEKETGEEGRYGSRGLLIDIDSMNCDVINDEMVETPAFGRQRHSPKEVKGFALFKVSNQG